MLAPVLSQPSLPLNNPAGIEISPDEVKAVRARLEREDLTVPGLSLRRRQVLHGSALRGLSPMHSATVSLDGCYLTRLAQHDLAPFFERHVTTPHSVVTAHLIDEAGQPTIAARDEILEFFRHRLTPSRSDRSS